MKNKLQKISKKILISLLLLNITSCKYSNNNLENISNSSSNLRYDLNELSKRDMGVVSLKFEDNNFFKKIDFKTSLHSIPRTKKTLGSCLPDFFKTSSLIFGNDFETKAIDFSNQSIRKLVLEIQGFDLDKPTTKEIDWQPGQTATFSVPVIAGKNRIISLYAVDAGNRILGKIMGALDVIAGQNNSGKVNYFETVVSQALLSLKANPTLGNNINLQDLRKYLLNLTGYDEAKNTFNKINPSELNINSITKKITELNGSIPKEGEVTDLKSNRNITVNLDFTGAKILISDLNSQVVNSTKNLSTKISNVTPGEWDLTVYKQGFVPQTFEINVKDFDLNLDLKLKEDKRAQTEIVNQKYKITFLEPIEDEENGIEISDMEFELGTKKQDGSGEEYISGDVEVEGFGEHYIEMEQGNFPIMSNEYDYVEVVDKNSTKVFNLFADQELQEFGIEFEYEEGKPEFYLEANFDGSWSFDGKVNINNPKEAAQQIVNHPITKDVSIQSIAFLYELFVFDGNIPKKKETLVPMTCVDDGLNKYNSFEFIVETLKETYLLMKETRKS